MPNEKEGFIAKLFGRRERDEKQEKRDIASPTNSSKVEEVVNANRDRSNQIARTLETITALAGISDKLGTPLQREKRVTALRSARDEFINMPHIDLDITSFDLEVLSCLKQLGGSVEAGDVVTCDFGIDGIKYAVKVRAQATGDSITIMKLHVNRMSLSGDLFGRTGELAAQEKTLAGVRERQAAVNQAIKEQVKTGKEPDDNDLLMLSNLLQQEKTITAAINMLKTTISEYGTQLTTITVHINSGSSGNALSAEQMDAIIKQNQDLFEARMRGYKEMIQTFEDAADREKALTKMLEDTTKEHIQATVDASVLNKEYALETDRQAVSEIAEKVAQNTNTNSIEVETN